MKRYRVHLHSKPSPGSTYYDGYVDVTAEDCEEAKTEAVRKLRTTTFPDYPSSSWKVDEVECLS